MEAGPRNWEVGPPQGSEPGGGRRGLSLRRGEEMGEWPVDSRAVRTHTFISSLYYRAWFVVCTCVCEVASVVSDSS